MFYFHLCRHKKHCKLISKQRKLVEDGIKKIDGMPWGVREGVVPIIHMGDLLVRIGYQESDTLIHGNVFYREALKFYTMPIKFLRDGMHSSYRFVEDKILLMLVALGGDNEAISSWFQLSLGREGVDVKSLRSSWFDMAEPINGDEENLGFRDMLNIKGLVENDKFFHVLYLFNALKKMAQFRQNCNCIESYSGASRQLDSNAPMEDIAKNIRPYLGCDPGDEEKLSLDIQRAVAAFRYHGNELCLIHLRDSIPFSKEHVPDLFQESEKTSMPGPEIWMILQDCFFESGVHGILEEYFDDVVSDDEVV
jgi:hypothetical protein